VDKLESLFAFNQPAVKERIDPLSIPNKVYHNTYQINQEKLEEFLNPQVDNKQKQKSNNKVEEKTYL